MAKERLGKIYNESKKIQGGINQHNKEEKEQIVPFPNTAQKIAEQFGVSEKTIKRDAQFAKNLVDELCALTTNCQSVAPLQALAAMFSIGGIVSISYLDNNIQKYIISSDILIPRVIISRLQQLWQVSVLAHQSSKDFARPLRQSLLHFFILTSRVSQEVLQRFRIVSAFIQYQAMIFFRLANLK